MTSRFATFTNPKGDIYFDLQHIFPGFGNASQCIVNSVGSVCTPENSPFTLSQVALGKVVLSLSLSGIAHQDSAEGGYSEASFSFTSQNVTPGNISGIIAATNSAVSFTNSFSATVVASSVPEPASCLLIGAGLVAAGLAARRKARN